MNIIACALVDFLVVEMVVVIVLAVGLAWLARHVETGEI